MIGERVLLYCLFSILFCARLVSAAEPAANYRWTKSEMDPRPNNGGGRRWQKISDVRLLPEQLPFPKLFNCHEEKCKFDLYYFTGQGFSLANPKRKNILFVIGGPGQLVDNADQNNRMLGYLEASHNIVYFDVRGGGRSSIDGDNKYDQFLRAEYVADDIEKIRKAVLQGKPWDAIYSHSWGTLPAQLYAEEFGPKKVKALILSAPVVRDRDTQSARTKMAAENLQKIYTIYRSQTAQPCNCQDKKLPVKVITRFGETKENIADVRAVVGPPGSNNFCFLSLDDAATLSGKLAKVIDQIEEQFGSVDFVTDHYAALQKTGDSKRPLRFPKEFYSAIKQLQFTGGPDKDLSPYLHDFTVQVNAALVIGHYLTLDDKLPADVTLPQRQCVQDAPFLVKSACVNKFCGIVDSERKAIQSGGLESLRANQVYGVYDGMARALLRPGMVELDSDGCFIGKALDAFANGNGGGKESVRADARKIGVVAGEKVCLWTPKKHLHEVRTLILKGARDTVIAGCQAEDFYRDGLKGERALLEFHGMGHAMFIPTVDTQYGKALKLVLEKFQDLPTAQFHNDVEVAKSLKLLNAELRVPPASRAGCPQ